MNWRRAFQKREDPGPEPMGGEADLRPVITRLAASEGSHLEVQASATLEHIHQVLGLSTDAVATLGSALRSLSLLVGEQHQLTLQIQEAMTLRIEGEHGEVSMEHFSQSITHTMDQLVENILSTSTSSMQLVEEIENIQSRSRKMEDVLQELSEIAAKTNLLALNASIEAAHARKYGAGFAIVAGEVSALADRSARLNDAIQAHLGGTRQALENTETQIQKMATKDLSLFLSSKGQSTSLMSAMEASSLEVGKLVIQAEANAKEVRARIDDVVRSLQFEDLVRQSLGTAIQHLEHVLERGRGWTRAAGRLAGGEDPGTVLGDLERNQEEADRAFAPRRLVHHETLDAGDVELF